MAGGAWAAWAARGRRDSNAGNGHAGPYSGPPDDTPRTITRREWHDVSDTAHANNLDLVVIKHKVEGLVKAVEAMQASEVWEGFGRLEERLNGYIEKWDEGAERAKDDRIRIEESIKALSLQLADVYRKLSAGK